MWPRTTRPVAVGTSFAFSKGATEYRDNSLYRARSRSPRTRTRSPTENQPADFARASVASCVGERPSRTSSKGVFQLLTGVANHGACQLPQKEMQSSRQMRALLSQPQNVRVKRLSSSSVPPSSTSFVSPAAKDSTIPGMHLNAALLVFDGGALFAAVLAWGVLLCLLAWWLLTAAVCALKGKYASAILTLPLLLFGLPTVAAVRLARPDSWWARHRYDHDLRMQAEARWRPRTKRAVVLQVAGSALMLGVIVSLSSVAP